MKSKLIIIITIGIIIVVGYFFIFRSGAFFVADEDSVIVMKPSTAWFSETSRIYKNLLFHFSVVYPDNLEAKEYDDGTSASTITFEDLTRKQAFQIFIVPYVGNEVTPEQFKKDVPSGIRKEPVDVIIGGERATIFFSEDVIGNKTREVWFIKDGFLYEISTRAELDTWLAQILSTWRFDL
ncbi:MAG: hypothetical protein AAB453_02925 [Patescibacteria group bacterium]